MKLWYRCEMCSPDRSKSFQIEDPDPRLSIVYRMVNDHHKYSSPECPASKDPSACVEVMLVRMIQ